MKRKKNIHIITNLFVGGAEMMLYKLLQHSQNQQQDMAVIALMKAGPVGMKIRELGIPVLELNMEQGKFSLKAFLNCYKLLKKLKPRHVQTWMYHANLIGGVAAKLAGCKNLVWGLHHSNLSLKKNNISTVATACLCAILSYFVPNKIVSCSYYAKTLHSKIGYASSKMIVIPNGIDLKVFKPDPSARMSLSEELGIPNESIIITIIGRFNPQKDHDNFCKAAAIVLNKYQNCFFIMCGADITPDNTRLQKFLSNGSLQRNTFLLGVRSDIPRINAASDIFVLSSCGEAFPMVLGEAMACETPCVATDVGDSAYLVGETGLIVPPKDHEKLAQGIRQMIEMGSNARGKLGKAARRRIIKNFSIEAITASYLNQYSD